MAKVRSECLVYLEHTFNCLLTGPWNYSTFVLSLISSIGLQPRRHQAGGPVRCWESRDPSHVSHAEPCNLHALDGGDGREQVCMRLSDQSSSMKDLNFSMMMWMFSLFDVFQCPQLLLQLRGWIQTVSSKITNTSQEVTIAFIMHQIIMRELLKWLK